MPYSFFDSFGVGIIHNKQSLGGLQYQWDASADPTKDKELVIDASKKREPTFRQDRDTGIKYYRFWARKGKFKSSGKTNYTARLHILKKESDIESTVGLEKVRKQGYMCCPQDFKNIEYTAIVKVGGIKKQNESYTIKPHGAEHVEKPVEKTLCFGATFPYTKKASHAGKLYERELTHNIYEFFDVTKLGPHPEPNENWILLKMICYNVKNNKPSRMPEDMIPPALYVETWYSNKPFNDDGTINNNVNDLKLYWCKTDSDREAPTWGGKFVTLRVDMIDFLDVAYLSCYEISPPPEEPEPNTIVSHPVTIEGHGTLSENPDNQKEFVRIA